MPSNPDQPADQATGIVHEQLEGWVPPLSSDSELRAAVEKAFDYRGDVTIDLANGQRVEGYIFDRTADSTALSESELRLMPKTGGAKQRITYDQIARLAFTGRDTAAGKSFETWVRKYNEKKAAGETNIGLHPETLE